MQTRKPSEVDRIVGQIDETRREEHWRNPDRPNGQFVKKPRRQDPTITRAKTSVRTAVWRNGLDRLGQ
jgi:predicted TIM-barrel fold metal-dependent hydrolase